MAEFEKMNLESEDLVAERLEQMRQLFPEVFSEGENGSIDFEKLRLVLGDEVDEGTERYAFTWPGKADAIRQAQTTSYATLRPCVEKSRSRSGEDGSFDSDNIYIEGDNLEVLKLLQKAYHGQVKMIYIDPPYNTGHDFVYHDSFGDTIENYKEQAGLTGQSNADTSGRFHSDWCSMMYPRLKLARELLADDGVIFISIDDNEVDNLKKILDELYGPLNFVALINWKGRGGRQDSKYYAAVHEHILCYAKQISQFVAGEEIKTGDVYPKYDEALDRYYKTQLLRKWGSNSRREDRPNLYYPICAPDGSDVYPQFKESGKIVEGCWRHGKSTMQTNIEAGKVEFVKQADGSWIPYEKIFAPLEGEEKTKKYTTWIDESNDGAKEVKTLFGYAAFDFPKGTSILTHFLDMAALEDGDIVMDFFSGSASTAHAIIENSLAQNKALQYVLVQLPEAVDQDHAAYQHGLRTLCDIGEERIRRAGNKIAAEVEEEKRQPKLGEEPKQLPDIGFRVFKLDESGIAKPKPGELVLDVVKSDRSDMDIIFEMMLKWGLELTLPIEQVDAAGYPAWAVAGGELVCCLADGLTIEALEAIADMEPRRVLMRDLYLDDSLKLNAVQIFKRVEDKTGREVELRTV